MNKHGMGKGFMSIQRLTNPGVANLPTCVENDHGACSQLPASISRKPPAKGKKKSQRKQPAAVCLLFLNFIVFFMPFLCSN